MSARAIQGEAKKRPSEEFFPQLSRLKHGVVGPVSDSLRSEMESWGGSSLGRLLQGSVGKCSQRRSQSAVSTPNTRQRDRREKGDITSPRGDFSEARLVQVDVAEQMAKVVFWMVSHNRAFYGCEGQGHASTGSFPNICQRVFCSEGDIFWTQSLQLQPSNSLFLSQRTHSMIHCQVKRHCRCRETSSDPCSRMNDRNL